MLPISICLEVATSVETIKDGITSFLWINSENEGYPEDVIRAIGLAHGLVDVKVVAVDEIWSGLKFVIRVELR